MKYLSPAVGVRVYDNAINNCEDIVKWCDNKIWQQSIVSIDRIIDADTRKSKTIFIPFFSYSNDDIIHNMNKKVWTLFDEYAKDWDFTFSGVQDASVQKYDIGDFYKLHTDSGPGMSRIVSAVVYLNTVKKGGRTIFPHIDISVEPVEGRIVIFPSDYIYAHEAEAPESNTKYAAAYWAFP